MCVCVRAVRISRIYKCVCVHALARSRPRALANSLKKRIYIVTLADLHESVPCVRSGTVTICSDGTHAVLAGDEFESCRFLARHVLRVLRSCRRLRRPQLFVADQDAYFRSQRSSLERMRVESGEWERGWRPARVQGDDLFG